MGRKSLSPTHRLEKKDPALQRRAQGTDIRSRISAVKNCSTIPLPDQAELRQAWGDWLSAQYPWPTFGTHTFRIPRRDLFGVHEAFRIWLYRCCGDMAVDLGEAFATDTTRKRVNPITGEREDFTSRAYDGRWRQQWRHKSPMVHPVYVMGVEPHENGNLHMHSLLWFPEYYGEVLRTDLWRHWYSSTDGGIGAGLGRFEPPIDRLSVSQYIAKYVVKGGEIILSDSFGSGAKSRLTT